MKTRRRIILIVVLLVIVTLVIVTSTVFSLKNIEIVFYDINDVPITDNTKLNHFTQDDFDSIINSGEFKKGSTVFLINKQKHIDKLEANNPYIKIINLEIKFPNKIVIKAVEREEMYAVPSSNGYAICDDEMKVLRFSETVDDNVLLEGVDVSSASEGSFVNNGINGIVATLGDCLYSAGIDRLIAREKFSKISLVKADSQKYNLMFNTIYNDSKGVTITIENISNVLEAKVLKVINAFNYVNDNLETGKYSCDGELVISDNLQCWYVNESEKEEIKTDS